MIVFTASESGIHIDQCCVAPTVYLDHWAWRKISDCESLASRFSKALKSSGGTLALSWLNLLEFSKVTAEYQHQAASADSLFDAILPNVFFLDPNFYKVISREDEIQLGGCHVAPHADIESLKFFAKHNLSKIDSLKLLPKQNIFHLVTATEMASRLDALAELLVSRIDELRREYANIREFQLLVKRVPTGRPIESGTRFIARELLGSFLVDSGVKLTRNHAIDVSHAIVSVAYCDYVLLDGHWTAQVERARKRIAEGGMSFRMAKVFSERANGVEGFLQALESTRPLPPT